MAIPALIYAAWPVFAANRRRLPRMVIISLLLGLLGFAQYLYLYLRARAGADWVYGEPDTLRGLWDQFIGTEAARFIGPPGSLPALLENFAAVSQVFIRDLTLPGVVIGLAGLIVATRTDRHRRAAITMLLSGAAAYLFHVFVYTDVLSALTLPGTLALIFGWLFLGDLLLRADRPAMMSIRVRRALLTLTALVAGVALLLQNGPFVHELTHDPAGLQSIEHARGAPPGSTLMLAWGPRHFAVGFARDVRGELQAITLVDHKADFAAIAAERTLVTPEYTLYNHPVPWWEVQIGSAVYLRAAAPYLVEIATAPELAADPPPGVTVTAESVVCEDERLLLTVDWQTAERPPEDLSVFVHALDAAGEIVAQGDQRAPVYGWRPLTTWLPGEQVRDVYPVPLPEDVAATVTAVRYGLYRALDDGSFENVTERELPAACGE
jgi:hypothetical protein